MKTFLGVPLLIRGEPWGNVYLTEKEGGGRSTRRTWRSSEALADLAAIAIDHARRLRVGALRTSSSGRSMRSTRRPRSPRASAARPTSSTILAARGQARPGARVGPRAAHRAARRRGARRGRGVAGELPRRRSPARRVPLAAPSPAKRCARCAPSGSRTSLNRARFEDAGSASARRPRRGLFVPLRLPRPRLGVLGAFDRLDAVAAFGEPRTAAARGVRRGARRRPSPTPSDRPRAAAPHHRGRRAGARPLGARAARRDSPGSGCAGGAGSRPGARPAAIRSGRRRSRADGGASRRDREPAGADHRPAAAVLDQLGLPRRRSARSPIPTGTARESRST